MPLHEIGGIPACDLIDFEYPRLGVPSYWHTTQDTPDKCSPRSLAKVGWVLLEWLGEATQPSRTVKLFFCLSLFPLAVYLFAVSLVLLRRRPVRGVWRSGISSCSGWHWRGPPWRVRWSSFCPKRRRSVLGPGPGA